MLVVRAESVFLALTLILAASLTTAPARALAATNPSLMQLSEELAVAAMRSSYVKWEQSYFHGMFPRLDVILGAVEKIEELAVPRDGKTLGYLLTAKAQPSLMVNNSYVNATMARFPNGKSFEVLLYEEIAASSGKLTPADVYYMSIYLCDDDYWLAMLTAHNLLKEVAYASREGVPAILAMDIHDTAAVDFYYSISPQDLLSKLKNLRQQGDPHHNDLIGPWYHMFGVFFVSGLTSSYEAKFAANVETLTRWIGLGSTSDSFKEELNLWAAYTSDILNDIVKSQLYVFHKYMERMGTESINEQLSQLRNKHRELQDQLIEWNELAQGSVALSAAASHKMDYLRAYQRAVAAESQRLQAALSSR